MSEYEYEYTEANGWYRIYLSRKDHRAILPRRKIGIFNQYHYLHNAKLKRIVVEHHVNWIGTILAFLLLPISLVVHGFSNTKEIFGEVLETIPAIAKKRGAFVVDEIGDWEPHYNTILTRRK